MRLTELFNEAHFLEQLAAVYHSFPFPPPLTENKEDWCEFWRFRATIPNALDNRSKRSHDFPEYNAAYFPGDARWVIAEGPEYYYFHQGELHLSPIERFYRTTIRRTRQAEGIEISDPINLTIAAGMAVENSVPKFYAYYAKPTDRELTAAQFLSVILPSTISAECLSVIADIVSQTVNAHFYLFSDGTPKGPLGCTLHLHNWRDHSEFEFSEADHLLFVLITKYQPRLLAHCAAGLGRSITLLLAMRFFEMGISELTKAEDVLELCSRMISEIREVKPHALYRSSQLIMALQLAAAMHECQRKYATLIAQIPTAVGLEEHPLHLSSEKLLVLKHQTKTLAEKYYTTLNASVSTVAQDADSYESGSDDTGESEVSKVSWRKRPLSSKNPMQVVPHESTGATSSTALSHHGIFKERETMADDKAQITRDSELHTLMPSPSKRSKSVPTLRCSLEDLISLDFSKEDRKVLLKSW